MKVDSMISAMREKSIQKDKQKSNLILYQGAKTYKENFTRSEEIKPEKTAKKVQNFEIYKRHNNDYDESYDNRFDNNYDDSYEDSDDNDYDNSYEAGDDNDYDNSYEAGDDNDYDNSYEAGNDNDYDDSYEAGDDNDYDNSYEAGDDNDYDNSYEAGDDNDYDDSYEDSDDNDYGDNYKDGDDHRYDKEKVFEMLETAINEIKINIGRDFVIKQPEDIYVQNNIDSDKKNGIFMIDMYRDNMPKEMDEKLKRSSIMGILQSFEISTQNLEADALQKKNALKKEHEELKAHINTVIAEQRKMLKKLEQSSSTISEMIKGMEEFYTKQISVIKEEQKNIDNTLMFMRGENLIKSKSHKKQMTKNSARKNNHDEER